MYQKANDALSAASLGLDAGYAFGNGFALTGTAKFNLKTKESNGVSSMFFGVTPEGYLSQGIVTLSYGVGVGVMRVELNTAGYTRLAIAPSLNIDFAVSSCLSANLSTAYVASLDDVPGTSFVLPAVGVGYRF